MQVFTPNGNIDKAATRWVVGVWLIVTTTVWLAHPSVFLPTIPETWAALQDLWFNANLITELVSSVQLNIEAIVLATLISLALAYLWTIPAFRPPVAFVGKLRFLSLAGLGFAFTLMTSNGHELRVAVLVFMVVVYFVVAMIDIVAQIPKEQYDLAKTLRMGPWETLYEVVIYGQLDQAFIVLRQTAAMSWFMVATAEGMSMSGGGLGMLLNTSNKHFHLAEVLALQLIVLAVGLGQDYLIGFFRNTCCPWVRT